MKLGIFDSGLGGLLIAKSIRDALPDLDMVYFGDTLHLPYGSRSAEAIYEYSKRAVDFLFRKHDCNLIITACNTVSASALRRLQQEYLPSSIYSNRRILGVIVPTLECATEKGYKKIGVLGTRYTLASNIYEDELKKINPEISLVQNSAPLLVPMIENNGIKWIRPVIESYLQPIKDKGVECLILGCTHYSFIRDMISEIIGSDVFLISQDDIIPAKLKDYLLRHPEISDHMSNSGEQKFIVSDMTDSYIEAAHQIYNDKISIELADPDVNK